MATSWVSWVLAGRAGLRGPRRWRRLCADAGNHHRDVVVAPGFVGAGYEIAAHCFLGAFLQDLEDLFIGDHRVQAGPTVKPLLDEGPLAEF